MRSWRGSRRRRGWGRTTCPRPALRVSVASPFDYAAQTRAFVVTDVGAGTPARWRRAYRGAVPGVGRRRAGAVHGHQRGCRRCMRGSRRRWRRRASRCWRSTWTRWTTRRWWTCSGPRWTPACWARTRCATGWTCRGGRCGWWCSSGCPGRGRTSCTGSAGSICRAATPGVRRQQGAAAAAPGVRAAGALGGGPRGVRAAGPADAEPAAVGVPARGGGAAGGAGGGGCGDAGVPGRAGGGGDHPGVTCGVTRFPRRWPHS